MPLFGSKPHSIGGALTADIGGQRRRGFAWRARSWRRRRRCRGEGEPQAEGEGGHSGLSSSGALRGHRQANLTWIVLFSQAKLATGEGTASLSSGQPARQIRRLEKAYHSPSTRSLVLISPISRQPPRRWHVFNVTFNSNQP